MHILMDDKKSFEDFGMILIDGSEKPITPNFTQNHIKIPGMVGYYDFGEEIDDLPFTLKVGMKRTRKIEKEQRFNELVSFLRDEFGKPRQVKFIFDYEPDKFIYAKLASAIPMVRAGIGQDFQINMVAIDSRKYARFRAEEILWGSREISFVFPYKLGHKGNPASSVAITKNSTLQIFVDGLAIKPEITLIGSGNNVEISCNGQKIKLGSFSNTYWVVYCKEYVITKDSVNQMIDMDDFYLYPGNNDLKISGTQLNLEVSVEYRNEY